MIKIKSEIGALRRYAELKGVNLKVRQKTITYVEKKYGNFTASNGSEYYPIIGKTKVRNTYAKVFLSEHSENPIKNLMNRIFNYKKEKTGFEPTNKDVLDIIDNYIKK